MGFAFSFAERPIFIGFAEERPLGGFARCVISPIYETTSSLLLGGGPESFLKLIWHGSPQNGHYEAVANKRVAVLKSILKKL